MSNRVIASCLMLCYLYSLPSLGSESNHDAKVVFSEKDCVDALKTPSKPGDTQTIESLNILSWNIKKGSQEKWSEDLSKLAEHSNILFLQEAVFEELMKQGGKRTVYWTFTPGYKTRSYRSGLLTVSEFAPDIVCSLRSYEPWLRTPKTVTISRMPLGQSQQPVLLVNLHAINFSLGIESFATQLQSVSSQLAVHKGPIIMAGDFNTWSKKRMATLSAIAAEHHLQALQFEQDYRTKKFGKALDHVFVRGFTVAESSVAQVKSSDHNPISARLELLR